MRKFLLTFAAILAFNHVFAYISQSNWRWRNDDGNETTATWRAAQNEPILISSPDSTIRLRIQFDNTTGSDKGMSSNLQYATSVDGPWRYITRLEGNNAFVYTNKSDYLADQSSTTQQITGSANAYQSGKTFFKTDQFGYTLLNNGSTEFEYCLKPTANIDTGTVYYFRVPGNDYSKGYPALKTSATIATKLKLITNGGFESGLGDWTTTINGAAIAKITTNDVEHHYGENGLYARITEQGSPGDVKITHKPTMVNPGHVYLVRFWAKSERNNGILHLQLEGSSIPVYRYKIYTSWQEYQFAFKADVSQISLAFLFISETEFIIDDVEILDEKNTALDVPMNYMWQNKRNPTEYAWLSADGEISERLPDGRTVWTFSDGWYGYNDTTTNWMNTSQLLRNTLVVQHAQRPDGNLVTMIGGTVEAPKAIMTPPNPIGHDDFFWPRDMTVENDSLKILLPDTRQLKENDPVTYGNREAIGIFSLPDLVLRSIEWMPFIDTVQYGTLVKGDGAWDYAYSSREVSSLERRAIIARYPKNNLSVTQPWEFLSDEGWVSDYRKSKEIADVELYSVFKLAPHSYAAVFLNPLSDKVEAEFAENPEGPWGYRTTIGQIEGQADRLSYFGIVHEETEDNGLYTISYSNIGDIGQMLSDKTVYWPTYIRADIKSLSPYAGVLPVKLVSFTATPDDTRVRIEWKTTAEINNDHFEVERSNNGRTNWQNIASVKATTAPSAINTYYAYDESPLEGNNYYRLKQFDRDGAFINSEIRMVAMQLNRVIAKVYPNPSEGNLWFRLENYNHATIRARLTNMNGNTLFNKEINVQPTGDYKLPLAIKPAPGMYIVLLEGNDFKKEFKVIIR